MFAYSRPGYGASESTSTPRDATLTEAAHAAGFADSAHLSRTFRRMFGIAAATLRVS